MKELKEKALDLLKQVEGNQYKEYEPIWRSNAVDVLNEYYIENGREDEEIYDLTSDIFEDMVKYNLESRGWLGVKCFLADVESSSEYAYIDAYGNASSCDWDFVERLKDIVNEIEESEE